MLFTRWANLGSIVDDPDVELIVEGVFGHYPDKTDPGFTHVVQHLLEKKSRDKGDAA